MYIDFYKYDNMIKSVVINNKSNEISLITDTYKYMLFAIGDCCSHSNFKIYKEDFSFLVGKIIKNINQIELPKDYKYDKLLKDTNILNCCIKEYLYEITFKNSNDTFQFILINYSNGFYHGWIVTEIVY